MPFTLVHAGKYKTEDKLKIQTIHKTKLPWFKTLGQETRWAYSTMLPSPQGAVMSAQCIKDEVETCEENDEDDDELVDCVTNDILHHCS